MNLSEPFIRRPVATSLLSLALLLMGGVAFRFLPVAALPQVEFPTINVSAGLPGASPETMASAVATPLERQLGHIAGVNEMTSHSSLGSTNIALQFDLSRSVDAAARDVQAAINAARTQLPANLPMNPTYRKVNPADAPILIIALTSDTLLPQQLYDVADSVLAQKLSQVQGVGQVGVGGGAQPAVRVTVNPIQLASYGLSLASVQTAMTSANANTPKGELIEPDGAYSITTNDQIFTADEYRNVIISYKNAAAVRIGDVATVSDSVADVHQFGVAAEAGWPVAKRAVFLIIFRQPGANILTTVDAVKQLLPTLAASTSPSIHSTIMVDRTISIKASVADIERTLIISICLVVVVVFVFLRNIWATIIPSISVPLSLVATFGAMYLLNYSIDNLSLMALTVSTGFVVDDAIVVLENITRYLQAGETPLQAALAGSQEIAFTVLSMSLSLVAVFIPLLMMGGIVGRLFREFAVTLSVAVGVSLLVSLTTTPMMCSLFLKPESEHHHGRLYMLSERGFAKLIGGYESALKWVLRHAPLMLAVTVATVCLTVYLYIVVPKGFFPQQDTGRLVGQTQAAQDISFADLTRKQLEAEAIVAKDPAVQTIVSYDGGGSNMGNFFVTLKPKSETHLATDVVINRLRPQLNKIEGLLVFMQNIQDIRIGGRSSSSQYQYTLQDSDLSELNLWAPKLMDAMKKMPELRDVASDAQMAGLAANLTIDRDTAARFGIQPQAIDQILGDSFGQSQVSTIYTDLNQYHAVLEVDPTLQQGPDGLKSIYVPSSTGTQVPLSAIAHYTPTSTSLAVNHQSQLPSITLSFNLAPNVSLSQAVAAINKAQQDIALPSTMQAGFAGTAAAFSASLKNEPILILVALFTVYIVLGVLYESWIHPVTILSTLPSAGVGALLALIIFHTDFDVIGLIGIILLIGIVKKNAIMMIDFAITAERAQNIPPEEAIYQACVLRFRPIMMTTLAALFGGLPLALGSSMGSELRRPLGITIVGGLLVSQMLTLFTTPVIYLYMDRIRLALTRKKPQTAPPDQPPVGAAA